MAHSKQNSWYLGHRLFRNLSRPERRNFRKAFEADRENYGAVGKPSLKEVLNERFMSGGDLTLFYVDWKATEQGVRYWLQIKDRQEKKFKPVTNDETDF